MKNTYKQALILCFAALLLAATLLSFCACDRQETIAQNCIRIHIRANSNSAADQAVKLEVRDKLTEYLSSRLDNCKTKADAAAALEQSKGDIIEIANRVLKNNNFDYKAHIRLNNEYFPQKSYGEYVFPEGYYDAVVVELGSGEGDNWWCVAFPPLCFVPDANGEKIVYKSFAKELLDKLFKRRSYI